jgi:endonuclease/exonuclease/phosphatase (EEP) superfamily protein YafD
MSSLARRGVTAIVTVLGILTMIGFFDRFSPYLELGTFFRLQYAALLLLAAVAAVALRLLPIALVALALATVNMLVIAPSGRSADASGAPRLRLLVLNVEHGNQAYGRVARLIDDVDPDVVGLTELTPAWTRGLANGLERFSGRGIAPARGAYGIGLYSRLPLASISIQRFPPDGPPSVVATLPLDGRRVHLVLTHVHTPFAGRIHTRQLHELGKEGAKLGSRLALCGDFNDVPWSAAMRSLMREAGLDGTHVGYGLDGTWPAGSALLRIPIDNCFIGEGLSLVRRSVGPNVGSDHLPLIIDLSGSRRLRRERTSR